MTQRVAWPGTKIILFSWASLLGWFCAAQVQAATLYFSPSEGRYRLNENFVVSVFVDAELPINAVQAVVTFSTEYLEAVEVRRSGINSIIDLWVQRPSFSNAGAQGNVRFEGVALNPGFVGSAGKIVDTVWRAKKAASADLAFTDFAVLANDGLGTNVTGPPRGARFTFLPATSQPGEEEAADEDLKTVAEKLTSLEEKLDAIKIPAQVPQALPDGVRSLLGVLPPWIQISTLVLIGVASLVLSFIVLSLGIIILIWFWSHVWQRSGVFLEWPGRTLRKLLTAMRFMEKEFSGDVRYSIEQLRKDFQEARDHPSFRKIFKDYWASIARIAKRFVTRNRSKHTDVPLIKLRRRQRKRSIGNVTEL